MSCSWCMTAAVTLTSTDAALQTDQQLCAAQPTVQELEQQIRDQDHIIQALQKSLDTIRDQPSEACPLPLFPLRFFTLGLAKSRKNSGQPSISEALALSLCCQAAVSCRAPACKRQPCFMGDTFFACGCMKLQGTRAWFCRPCCNRQRCLKFQVCRWPGHMSSKHSTARARV